MGDLLVVGLDLRNEQEVYCDETRLEELRPRGYSGDRSLVCALCYAGVEAPVGSQVPLVVRGREGGERRPHFAHPAGRAPDGGHAPESVWHLEAKHQLARWARSRPNVAHVHVERWTPDLKRRADVEVRLTDETRLALEAQATRLSDPEWIARHRDYRAQGMIDAWVWWPGLRFHHWVVSKNGLPLWQLDPVDGSLSLLAGRPHPKPSRWWAEPDAAVFALHSPPCSRDRISRLTRPLSGFGLSRGGIVLPGDLRKRLSRERKRITSEARRLHQREQADEATRRGERNRTGEHMARADDVIAEPAHNPIESPPQSYHCAQCYAKAIIQWRRTNNGT